MKGSPSKALKTRECDARSLPFAKGVISTSDPNVGIQDLSAEL